MLTISNLARFLPLSVSSARPRALLRARHVNRLDVQARRYDKEIRTLSGGNQQKMLIGRALAVEPRILIFDEPTRGVDIGAKQEIYPSSRARSRRASARPLVSSEMEEILRLCDRIVVLSRGRVAATLTRAEASEASIMRAAALPIESSGLTAPPYLTVCAASATPPRSSVWRRARVLAA